MKIMLSAGEVSGDLHGARLVRELKKLVPSAQFFGMGAEHLAAEGVRIDLDVSQRGSIGISEALPNLLPMYSAFSNFVKLLEKERPDLLILIDSQALNMPLAKKAHKLGIKTVYYITPQEWLWGTARGVQNVVDNVDLIVAIFEKEYSIYKKAGGRVVYFGHPLLDIVKPSTSPEEILTKQLNLAPDKKPPIISLCPGSRAQELKNILPVLLKSARLIKKCLPETLILFPLASAKIFAQLSPLLEEFRAGAFVGKTYDLLSVSDLALCASGTINMECSLLGTPNLMCYTLSPLSCFVGRHILKIDRKIPFFSMPNIIMGKQIIPELVVKDFNPEKIAATSLALLADPAALREMKASFALLKTRLGSPGVLPRVAAAILA